MPTHAGPVRLELTANGCAGYICAYPRERIPRVVMFDAAPDRWTRYDLYHELGHVWSARDRTARTTRAIEQALGWRGWHEEQFAMAYSWCARNPLWPAGWRYPGYGYTATRAQHRHVCTAIRANGAK